MNSASLWAIVVSLNAAPVSAARALVPDLAQCGARETPAMQNDKPSSNTKIVVLDLSLAGKQREVVNRVFSLSGTDADPKVQELRTLLLAMRNCPPNAADVSSAASPVIALLETSGGRLADRSSVRWISNKGDKLEVYVLRSPGPKGNVEVEEKPRPTRLSSDLVTLAELAQKIAAQGVAAAVRLNYSFTYREFYLAKTRATLKVVGSLLSDKPKSAQADSAGPSDTLKVLLITGPKEHFFLSANVAFTKVRQIKYDETTRSLQPVGKPKEFFVGFDYTIGDIFDDAKQSGMRGFRDGLYLGLMLEGSSRPFNQLALTLGFRHSPPGLEKLVSFDVVSPYVGVVWARSDRLSGTAVSPTVDSKYGKGRFVAGLSLNLDKALGWVGAGQ